MKVIATGDFMQNVMQPTIPIDGPTAVGIPVPSTGDIIKEMCVEVSSQSLEDVFVELNAKREKERLNREKNAKIQKTCRDKKRENDIAVKKELDRSRAEVKSLKAQLVGCQMLATAVTEYHKKHALIGLSVSTAASVKRYIDKKSRIVVNMEEDSAE
eukprot:GFUD01064708.1.p1 GENE.GFUD01064708.1~~GFUD01064708.1.p1  ORF type:complete len:174 (-),score=49.48 GFUD01064708.1:147-617(-)